MEPITGIVIRKDGTVPFDDNVTPTARLMSIGHLKRQGHEVEDVPGTKHVRIKNWAPPNS